MQSEMILNMETKFGPCFIGLNGLGLKRPYLISFWLTRIERDAVINLIGTHF